VYPFFTLEHNELAKRQLIFEQMLIDTSHIDHLRVNFVAHFNTENNIRIATNDINTLIKKYPREMTSQVRQWVNEQQKTPLNTSLGIVDVSKTIDHFEEYIKDLEENINEPNQMKFKVYFSFVFFFWR
jgi:hypothetical protein